MQDHIFARADLARVRAEAVEGAIRCLLASGEIVEVVNVPGFVRDTTASILTALPLLPCPECGSDLGHAPMCSKASPRKPGDPCDCAATHAELTRLRAEVARLTPPPGCRWVAVSEELMAQMGEWSDPVRVKIEAVDERQVTLAVSRYAPATDTQGVGGE